MGFYDSKYQQLNRNFKLISSHTLSRCFVLLYRESMEQGLGASADRVVADPSNVRSREVTADGGHSIRAVAVRRYSPNPEGGGGISPC